MKYTVYVRRTETYDLPVNVDAASTEEAAEKVRRMDEDDAFVNQWNELQPEVSAEYPAEEATDYAECGEGVCV